MKLRIQDDSLRLRLTRPEVERLAAEGRVEAAMHVAPGVVLRYTLETGDSDTLRARFADGALTVVLPAAWVRGWPDDARVGFEGTQDAGDGQTLALLVEKDFACLHRDAEEPGTYPNPHVLDTDAR